MKINLTSNEVNSLRLFRLSIALHEASSSFSLKSFKSACLFPAKLVSSIKSLPRQLVLIVGLFQLDQILPHSLNTLQQKIGVDEVSDLEESGN
ncbi:hypothetical protein BpHYR1_008489 [Brachionus plicatilis]|uniref:Uncharacterized protein n=1 Tax=Brachionus plicatilis TaxID=10195 RepID=A0A3M7RGF3_BRAPC|nr:hypothetical protein BpHYR1_008489 [Brachionus plicatilis]